MRESDLLKHIQVSASKSGARLLRNNVGMLKDENGTYVRYGLGTGSSDLIGWTPIKVTQEMVGTTVAVFTAIECKTGYLKTTPEQDQFIAVVLQAGGIAGVARTEKDALDIIGA